MAKRAINKNFILIYVSFHFKQISDEYSFLAPSIYMICFDLSFGTRNIHNQLKVSDRPNWRLPLIYGYVIGLSIKNNKIRLCGQCLDTSENTSKIAIRLNSIGTSINQVEEKNHARNDERDIKPIRRIPFVLNMLRKLRNKYGKLINNLAFLANEKYIL